MSIMIAGNLTVLYNQAADGNHHPDPAGLSTLQGWKFLVSPNITYIIAHNRLLFDTLRVLMYESTWLAWFHELSVQNSQ